MPIRVGTGSSAVNPPRLYLAGAEAQRVMVGTGSSAIEAWARPLAPYSAVSTSGMDTEYAVWATMNETIVSGNGPARISASWHYQSVGFYFGSHMTYVQILVNGTPIQEWSHSRQASAWQSSGSADTTLRNGDTVTLRGMSMNTNNVHLRHILSWSLQVQPL